MTTNDQTQEASVDEMNVLKQRATMLGIKFSNNIGLESLREKVRQKLQETSPESEADPEGEDEVNPLGDATRTPAEIRRDLQREAMKLVRCRITCMNPNKKEWYGEIITVANGHIGTVRKFVPFGEATEDGYHVPNCIYKLLVKRQFQNIRTIKERGTGRIRIESTWAKEFAIEVLPPLSAEELKILGAKQANSSIHS